MASPASAFGPRGTTTEIEAGLSFQPRFDGAGLIPAIVTEVRSGRLLMFAWMNVEALAKTIETRRAHFWSRSRGRIWIKGEESGNYLDVVEMRVDCDQDAIHIAAEVRGDGLACHTGARSCFYRRVPLGQPAVPALKLEPVRD